MKSIAFYNLKGGVGKTAAAVNVAHIASLADWPTILWDFDSQGSASWYFRCTSAENTKISQLLKGKLPLGKLIQKTNFPNLDLIPADASFRNIDIQFEKHDGVATLNSALSSLSENYRLLVMDCPPSLSRLAEAIFQCVDLIFVPVIPTPLSLQTFERLLEFAREKGIDERKFVPFFSMVDRRKQLHRETIANPPAALKNQLGGYIPYASDIEKMGISREPVNAFAASSVGALAYRLLWEEVSSRLEPNKKKRP